MAFLKQVPEAKFSMNVLRYVWSEKETKKTKKKKKKKQQKHQNNKKQQTNKKQEGHDGPGSLT